MKKIKRSDADVIMCGYLVQHGLTIKAIEKFTGIPHSTIHWVIMNRLERLDKDGYDYCKTIFGLHKRKKMIADDWTD